MNVAPPSSPVAASRRSAAGPVQSAALSRDAATARTWFQVGIIATVFSVIVAVVMVVTYQRSVAEDPLHVQAQQALREKLHASPKDEALKKRIREADLIERQRYFARVQRNKVGGGFIFAGAALAVFSFARVRSLRRRPPVPRALAPWTEFERGSRQSVLAVGVVAGAVLAGVFVVGLQQRMVVSGGAGPAVAAVVPVNMDWLKTAWPQFRGADGSGVSAFTNVPLAWNLTSRENIAWVSPLPLVGFSSPVVVGGKVFVTGADKMTREILCYDAANGALLWRLPAKLVSGEAVEKMELPSLTGAAVATVAADHQRVFAIFGSGELIAADHSGRQVWSKNLGKPENMYGLATSPVMWRDKLLLQFDQGEAEAAKSRLYSFDGATGNIAWQTKRALPSSWTTPIIIKVGEVEQIVCVGEPWMAGYDLKDGKELWRFEGFGSDLTPSPIFAGGLVLAVSPNQFLYAIRPDGRGDVTKTHLAWKVDQNIPDIVSPVSNGELVFLMETHGNLVCLDVKDGKKVWEHNFDMEFNSSASIIGDKLLVISKGGEAIAVKAAREFKELSRSKFGDMVKASPAFTDGRMFIRGTTNLFCIASSVRSGVAAEYRHSQPVKMAALFRDAAKTEGGLP
jgi:outer membrane protein assembly factor BamB